MKGRFAFFFSLGVLATGLSGKTSAENTSSSSPTFEKEILPIFEKSCLACHSAQSPQSGLVLETVESLFQGGTVSGPAVIAGESSRSPLLLYLKGEKEPRMPLDAPLPEAEITLIARWIDQLKPAGQKEVETQLAGGITSDQDFEESIRPILEKNCFSCHNAETHRSGLVLETVESLLKGGGADGPAIVAGKSRESPLILHLRGDKAPRMPLEGVPLAEEKITRIASWIDGLEVSTIAQVKPKLDWPWIKLERPDVPQVQHQEWVTNPIDAFILAKLETKSLEPAPAVSKRALLRRISFDLTGLPPTPEEMQRFLQDSSPDAYERQIDRLLASPHYGERWARHWLDLVRYADTKGGYYDPIYPHIWRYRDYVIRAFNQGRPYDRFIREQIAGDSFRPYGAEGRIALGFMRVGAQTESGGRREILDDLVGTTGSVFLGMTVACARCHDHKFDPIPQRDYYRMEAFFTPMSITGPTALPFTEYELPHQEPEKWEKKAEAWQALYSKYYARAKAIVAQFKERVRRERSFLSPEDLKDRVVYGDVYASYRVSAFELRETMQKGLLFSKAERDLYNLARRFYSVSQGFVVSPMHPDLYEPKAYSASDPGGKDLPSTPDTYVLKVGNPKARGEAVGPGFLSSAIGNSDPVDLTGGGSRRKLLAEWISSPENPLTARVMVNRIWQHHFGEGLVRTPSDFGQNGSGTLHRELIDWLASEFIEQGWNIQAMHRLILGSSLYRQSMYHPRDQEFETIDSANRYLWKMEPIRLEAESIRDSILAVSGELNRDMGGPAVFSVIDDELQKRALTIWEASPQQERNRRSIYMMQKRATPTPWMAVFDGPNLNQSCEVRGVTTVTPQVFALFNSEFVHRQSRQMAARIRRQVGADPERQIERAFELALQRLPTQGEKEEFRARLGTSAAVPRPDMAFLGKPEGAPMPISLTIAGDQPGSPGSLADLCLVLFNVNEFIFLE